MIIWSPFILDELAGLRDEVPITAIDDPTSPQFAEDSGFRNPPLWTSKPRWRRLGPTYATSVLPWTRISKRRGSLSEYSLSDAYIQTLGIAAEGKFPERRGTQENPEEYINAWANLEVGVDRRAPLSEFYAEDTINNLVEGLETGTRWGYSQGYGELTSQLYDTRIMAEIVRQFTDGEFSAEEAAARIQRRGSSSSELS